MITLALLEPINMLRWSGYDVKYRYYMVKGVMERFKQMNNLIVMGEMVRVRNKSQIDVDKKNKKGRLHKYLVFER